MRVAELHLQKFMSHDDTRVELPATGVVLVTGSNGSGKSSLVEAVSTACWGKTLRGTKPWRGKGGVVELRTDALFVQRHQQKLAFGPNEDDAASADTLTKTQELLLRQLPDRDVWVRSSVFSSSDAETFSRASDGERKRMLEALLGLDKLDAALDACRQELRTAKHNVAKYETELAVKNAEVAGMRERINDADEALTASRSQASAPKKSLDQVRKSLQKARAELADADAEDSTLSGELATWQERARVANREPTVAAGEDCPICGQRVTDSHRKQVKKERARAFEEASERVQALTDQRKALAGRRRGLQERVEELRRAQTHAEAAEAAKGHLARAEAKRQLLVDQLADAEDALGDVQDLAAKAKRRARLLEAAERVLGLQGVRAHLLGQALAGIEHVANVWLSRIAAAGDAELVLKLSPYSESAKGAVKDAISLRIDGAGGESGDYRGASNGERRRIDVALVLALGEVAAAAHGLTRGTLFFDEVFDALDVDGVISVIEIIEELARSTCVVLISHNAELKKRLRPAMTLEVRKGVVKVR